MSSDDPSARPPSSAGSVFREGFEYDFSSLDPMSAHIDPPSIAVYETLMAKGPDAQPHPLIAESWRTTTRATEWLVRLHPDITFHSGAPCDAPAVLRSLEAVRWQLGSDHQLWYWDAVDTVSVVDPLTLRFALVHPSLRFPSLLWGTHTSIFNEELRQARSSDFGTMLADGTGPFKLVTWSPDRIVVERWDAYGGPTTAFLQPSAGKRPDRVEWVSVTDEARRLDALESGALDCIHAPPVDDIERLSEHPDFVVYRHPQPSNMYLSLDWRRRELGFDDLRVRRAVDLGIDRRSLVATVFAGNASPTWGPLPPGHEFHDPRIDEAGRHKAAEARALLDSAGWLRGADGVRSRDGNRLEFPCVVQDDQVFRRVAEQLSRQLAELGMAVHVEYAKPFADFYSACRSGVASALSKWLWQDPMDALIGFSSMATQPFPNWSHASSGRLDRAFAAWIRGESADDLQAAASEAQSTFVEDLPYIPLLTPDEVWVWRQGVHGFAPSPALLYPYYHSLSAPDD